MYLLIMTYETNQIINTIFVWARVVGYLKKLYIENNKNTKSLFKIKIYARY